MYQKINIIAQLIISTALFILAHILNKKLKK
jgi:hypothetical protein